MPNIVEIIISAKDQTEAAWASSKAKAGKAGEDAGNSFSSGLQRTMKSAVNIGSGLFVAGLTASVVAGEKLEASQVKLERAVTAVGGSMTASNSVLDAARSKMESYGYSNSQVDDSLTSLIRISGSVTTGIQLEQTAADLAAKKHISLADATTMVSRAAVGNNRSLRDMNITMATGTTWAQATAQANKILGDRVNEAGGIAKFAAANHMTLGQAQTLVKQAAEGSIPALNKLGIDVLPKSATAAQRLAEYTAIMNAKIGGEAAAAAGTSAGKMEVLKAKLTDIAAALGEKLLPFLSQLVDFLSRNLNIIVPLVAVFGGLMIAVKVAEAIRALGIAFGILDAAMSANPFVAITVAIIALAVIIVKYHDQIWNTIVTVWNAIKNFLSGIWNAISSTAVGVWNNITSFFIGIWNSILNTAISIWNSIVSFFAGVWGGIQGTVTSVWNGIQNTLAGIWNSIASVAVSIWNGITSFFAGVWAGVQSAAVNAWNAVVSFLTGIWNSISATAISIWNGIVTFFSTIWSGIQAAAVSVWNGVVTFLVGIWNSIYATAVGIWNGIVAFFSTIWSGIQATTVAVWNSVVAFLVGIWNSVYATATGIWNGIVAFFAGVWNGIQATAVAVWNGIVSWLVGIWNSIYASATGIWNGIVAFLSGIWNSVMGAFQNAWNAIIGYLRQAWETVRTDAVNAWNAVIGFLGTIGGQIINIFSGAINWLVGAGAAIINGLKNGIVSIANGIGSWVISTVQGPITGAFSGAINWLVGVGGDIINGLKNGIWNIAKDIGSWIKGAVVDPIINAVKDFFGVTHSPSEVMKPIGEDLVLGLIEGMSKTNPTQLVGRIFGGMPQALAKLISKGLIGVTGLPPGAVNAIVGLGESTFMDLLGGAAAPFRTAYNLGADALHVLGGIFNLITGGHWSGGDTHADEKQYAGSLFAGFGWGTGEQGPLEALWQGESGWDPGAVNPTSGAYGIPQALPAAWGHPYNLGDWQSQINWGLQYIKATYGSPSAAWGAWQSRTPHWYGAGGIINERIHGIGMSTGQSYVFGERGREIVLPEMGGRAGGQALGATYNITIQAGVIGSRLELENWIAGSVNNLKRKGRI
jgi:phage-related protein